MSFMKFSEWANKKSSGAKPDKAPAVHSDLDSWLGSVDNLKKDLSNLKDTLFHGKASQEEPEEAPKEKKPFGKKGDKEAPKDKKPFGKGDEEKDDKPKSRFGFGKKSEKEVPEGGPMKPFGKKPKEEPDEEEAAPKKKFDWGKEPAAPKLKFNFGQQRQGPPPEEVEERPQPKAKKEDNPFFARKKGKEPDAK